MEGSVSFPWSGAESRWWGFLSCKLTCPAKMEHQLLPGPVVLDSPGQWAELPGPETYGWHVPFRLLSLETKEKETQVHPSWL